MLDWIARVLLRCAPYQARESTERFRKPPALTVRERMQFGLESTLMLRQPLFGHCVFSQACFLFLKMGF